ncbi:hypothetical protein GCM10029992_15740 [Glycomyces albus]
MVLDGADAAAEGDADDHGQEIRPPERFRNFASCDTSWSNAGYTKPSNWISQMGR